MKPTLVFFTALISLTVASVQAAIIEGTFKGTVILSSDNGDTNAPNPYFDNLWSENIIGQTMTGSFRYNTELMPANTGVTGQERISATNSWLEILFNVDGKTFAISSIPPDFSMQHSYEALNIANIGSSTGIRDFTQEYFGLWDEMWATNGDLKSFTYGGISLLDSIVPLLNGINLEQQFTWIDTGVDYEVVDDIPGLAILWIDNKLSEKSQMGAVLARLNEVNAAVSPVEVPEPSIVILMTLSLLSLVSRRFKLNFRIADRNTLAITEDKRST